MLDEAILNSRPNEDPSGLEVVVDEAIGVERNLLQRDAATLELRVVENVVDDSEETLAAGANRLGRDKEVRWEMMILPTLRISWSSPVDRRPLLENLRPAQDGSERRPHF